MKKIILLILLSIQMGSLSAQTKQELINTAINFLQQKNYQGAIPYLKRAIEAGDTRDYGALGECYSQIKEYQQAIPCFKRAIEAGKTQWYGELGYCYFQIKEYQQAIPCFKRAIEVGDTWCYNLLGHCFHKLKDWKQAISNYQKALEEGDREDYMWIGYCYSNLKEHTKAVEYYQKAIENGDDSGFHNLGWCYYTGEGIAKDYVKAAELFQKGVEKENAWAYDNMGNCYYYGRGVPQNYQKALEHYQKAKEGGCYYAYGNLARMYAEGKGVARNMPEAYRLIELALAEDPKSVEILSQKGEIYLLDNKAEEALALWQQIQNLDPDFAQNSSETFVLQMQGSVDVNIAHNPTENENTFVLIVANETYKQEAQVPHATNDGDIFREYCHKTLGVPEINIKYLPNATGNDIKYGINWLKQLALACDGKAKILFYYAGHGIPDEAKRTAALLPVDGYGSDVSTGYSLHELYKNLQAFPTRSVVVFLDACFSGAQREGSMLASARGVAIKVKEEVPEGNIVVFSAAQGDETAYAYEGKRHGLFTYYLLKKLQETKGNTTLGELTDFVTSQVKRQSVLLNGKLQVPSLLHSGQTADSWRTWKLK